LGWKAVDLESSTVYCVDGNSTQITWLGRKNDNTTRMHGKAQHDGRPAVKWMETFTRDMGKVRM